MDDITVYVLLEFLYNRFAVTFILCSFGAIVRETILSTKPNKSKRLNIKKFVISTMFSTFLVCACSEYIDLPIGVYLIFCIFCGIWGIRLMNIAASGSFFKKFTDAIAKIVSNPVLKSAFETASDVFEEQEKEEKSEEEQNNKDEEK